MTSPAPIPFQEQGERVPDPSADTIPPVAVGSPASEPSSSTVRWRGLRTPWVDAVGIASFLVLALLVLLRLDEGVDLSDESYYALFIDDWLKGGIGSSSFDVIHQTAALVVYPFAWLYVQMTGSTDGLMLFFRYLYLLGSAISSLLIVVALRRLGLGLRAWTVGLILVAFVPFGLPAPSYNTIGMQALVIALAAYALGISSGSVRSMRTWYCVSAAAWAVTTVAYPPMLLASLVMAALVAWLKEEQPGSRFYIAAVGVAQLAAWVVVVAVMSMSRLLGSLTYQATMSEEGGVSSRFNRGIDLLASNRWFAVLCLAAVVLGVVRRKLPLLVLAGTVAALVGLSFLRSPALFVRSHDVVTLLALSGVGILWSGRRAADATSRILGILFTVSFAAGLATMAFANHPLFNFSIGAALAASLALTVPGRLPARGAELIVPLVGAFAIVALMTTSLGYLYGDTGRLMPGEGRQRITAGYFAGIRASDADAGLLEIVRTRVAPDLSDERWVVFVGRTPGVMLDTDPRLRMRTPYPISTRTRSSGLEWTAEFYASATNRPDTVIFYRDRYFEPINPFGDSFETWYGLEESLSTPLGVLEMYRLRAVDVGRSG